MEIVLAEPQEEESMYDLPFQTASLPAGLRARRPHEAAQASHVRPLPLPLAAPGPADSEPGWGGGNPSGTAWHPRKLTCGWGGIASYFLSHNQVPSLNNRLNNFTSSNILSRPDFHDRKTAPSPSLLNFPSLIVSRSQVAMDLLV